jgi:DNA-directed RNA polymerase specialized sigma24 family protein
MEAISFSAQPQSLPMTSEQAIAFVEFMPDLRNFVTHYRFALNDVEDIVQEIAARVWEGGGKFQSPVTLLTYTMGVAKNVVREHRRGAARATALDLHAYSLARRPDGISGVAGGGVADAASVGRAVAMLSAKLGDAVEFYYFRRMSTAEASAAAGCTPAAFRRRLVLGRERLHSLLTRPEKDF